MTASTSVLLALVWPFLVAAAAWAIAVWALQLPDEQSTLIADLTTPKNARAEHARTRVATMRAEPPSNRTSNLDHGDDAQC